MIQEPLEISSLPIGPARWERRSIKLVTCLIRPEKLDIVVETLNKLNLVGGMTVTDVRGFGRQRGLQEHYRGGAYTVRFLPKIRVDLAVQDDDVGKVMDIIHRAAHTGHIGDGKIIVIHVVNAMRIRTQERGLSAL